LTHLPLLSSISLYKNKSRQMKKVLFFAATAIFFASCSNNQETTDKANQAKIDSMSQAFMKQHIIDSMNNATTVNTAAAAATVPVRHSHKSSSYERDHTYSGAVPANNIEPVASAPPAAINTVTGPTAEEIAAKKKADHKKELTRAAEGAAIGAGAGAIGGAIAGKNEHFKKQDAAIGAGLGAVVGAGAGLLLEKHKLKKDTTQH
jgi:hypothetical protein